MSGKIVKLSMPNPLAKLLATFFYVGDFPFAAGSLASLVGGLIAIVLYSNIPAYLVCFLVVTVFGFLSSGITERAVGQKDPSCIVIDEVSGALIAFFMLPLTWPVLITTYFLFRAFDMFKIFPANKFEQCPGSVGVMMDDIIAGIYTNIVMQLAIRLIVKI